jgi:hypothetical protein
MRNLCPILMALMLRRKVKTCQAFAVSGRRPESAPTPAAALIVIGRLLFLGVRETVNVLKRPG